MNDDPHENPSRSTELGWFAALRQRGVLRVAFSYAVIAWLTLQIGDVVMEPLGAPAWTMRVLIGVVVGGFPVALLLAWFFELTPAGIERDSAIGEGARPGVSGMRRYADLLIIGALLLAVVFLLARQEGWIAEELGPPVIAVLPFSELGGAADSYFGAGLADTMIHKLGQLSQLVVLASSSTFEFRGQGLDLRAVGAKLAASAILEGTVQRAGNQLRVNARLVDTASGTQLWSGSFERQSTDLFAVQDEIAGAVTQALPVVLSPAEEGRVSKASTLSLSAYDAYLLGQSKLAERDHKTMGEAITYFRQAIELDPAYALAHAGLAEAIYLNAGYRYWEVDWKVQGPQAQRAAATAQSLDPDLGEAYLAQALVAMGDNERGEGSVWPPAHIAALLHRAVELSPNNASAVKFLSSYTESEDEALALLHRAARLDPRSSIIRINLGQTYADRGEYEAAYEWFLEAATAGNKPSLMAYKYIPTLYLFQTGELDQAARWGRAIVQTYGSDWSVYPEYFHPLLELQAWDEAGALVEALYETSDQGRANSPMRVGLLTSARLAAAQGNLEEAEQAANEFSKHFLETLPGWPLLTKGQGIWTTMLVIQALADVQRGHPEVALERYRASLPDPETWYYRNFAAGLLPTPAMIAVLHRLNGDEESCEGILRDFLARTATMPIFGEDGIGFMRFTLHAFLGDTDAAIAELEAAVKAGWLPNWWALKFGGFDSKYAAVLADPRFASLYAEMENRVRRMREDFLANTQLPEGLEVR